MKALAYVLLGFVAMTLILAGTAAMSAPPAPVAGVTIQLSAEEAKACEAEGGCVLVTRDFLALVAKELQRLRKITGCI